jgi:multisubunit Na+/H+ antiporter MnhE subunit
VSRAGALAVLVLRFLRESVSSGWVTARLILRGTSDLRAGFVRMTYDDLDEAGVALLGALVTLTPGTTAVDIDPGRRELLLHVLDLSRAEETVAAIRHDFEQPLLALLGGHR